MQPKSCSSELPYDSVSEQDFVLVHQSKLKKNMFYCIELNLRTRWSVGRSVSRSVGRLVDRSVGWSIGRSAGRSVSMSLFQVTSHAPIRAID